MDYADDSTRRYLESFQTRGFVMVLPSAMHSLGEVSRAIFTAGWVGGLRQPLVLSSLAVVGGQCMTIDDGGKTIIVIS